MKKISLILLLISICIVFLPSCGKKVEKPHILLVTIDTLRRDHLSCYGHPRKTTPFIDTLAKEGLIFKNAVTPETITVPSHAATLTSLHPLSLNLTMNGGNIHDHFETVAEVLKQNGYYTIGTVAVKIMGRKYNFSQGFDSFSDQWDPKESGNTKTQRGAVSVNRSLFDQIEEYMASPEHKDKPLFIWVHYFDAHFEYQDHKDIQFKNTLPGKKGKDKHILYYDKEIRFVDRHIKQLHRLLEQKGLAKDLVTCITADHGEQFGEHGRMYRHSDLYSETSHVPLILHGPGIPKDKLIDTYVSTMDISVTLLDTANLKFPYPVEGLNLLEPKHRENANRKFLIMCNPVYGRSLQLLGSSYAYVWNTERYYKNWYLSGENEIPEDRFTPVPQENVKIRKNKIYISLPHSFKKELNYMVLRGDLKVPDNFLVNVKVKPYVFTGNATPPKGINQLNVFHPVTITDTIVPMLGYRVDNPAGFAENFRYVIIDRDEFENLSKDKFVKTDSDLFKMFTSPRKKTRLDELYLLETDVEMEKNLIRQPKLMSVAKEYKKIIYKVFKYYYLKKERFLKGDYREKDLSQQERETLKTLGYL